MTVLLEWDRVGVGPETAAVLPRFGFCRGVGGRRVEALVMVCVAIAHHLQVDVFSADEDCAEDAAVLVLGLPHYGNVFAEDVVRELLFRLLPEGLRLLGRVDCVEADLVLGVPVADDCDRVAVGNRDDAALEGFDSRRERGRVNRLRVGQLLPRGGCTAQTLRRGGCAAGVRLRVGGRYAALLRRPTPSPQILRGGVRAQGRGHRANDGERESEGGLCAVLHAVHYTIFAAFRVGFLKKL